MLDPKMRTSTDFPKWLNAPETGSKLQGKTVMMYVYGRARRGVYGEGCRVCVVSGGDGDDVRARRGECCVCMVSMLCGAMQWQWPVAMG